MNHIVIFSTLHTTVFIWQTFLFWLPWSVLLSHFWKLNYAQISVNRLFQVCPITQTWCFCSGLALTSLDTDRPCVHLTAPGILLEISPWMKSTGPYQYTSPLAMLSTEMWSRIPRSSNHSPFLANPRWCLHVASCWNYSACPAQPG